VASPPRVLRVDDQAAAADLSPTEPRLQRYSNGGGERAALAVRGEMASPAGALSAGEELELLRRQLLKVNRRLLAIELESQRRRSREVALYTAGVAYLLGKVLLWLGRA